MARTSVEGKLGLGFAISLLALAAIGWLSYHTTSHLASTQRWVAHTHEVMAALDSGHGILADAEAAQRGYLLTGDDRFLADFEKARSQVDPWLVHLRNLTADNPDQQRRLDELSALVRQRLDLLNNRVELRQDKGVQAASAAVAARRGKPLMDQVRQKISDMQSSENRLLVQRRGDVQAGAQATGLVILSSAVLAWAISAAAFLLIRRDLKLRAGVEKSLRQSEERFRLMVESVKDYAILMLDPGGKIVSWNIGAQRIKGYAAQEIIGQHFSCFYPREVAETGFPERELVEASATGRFQDEGWRVRKDGSRFWANVVVTAIRDPGGRLLGFVKVTRDLTEHRKAEQAMEERDRFFDLSRDLICLATFDGYFKTLNPAWEGVLGFTRGELMSRPFIEFVHPEDREATRTEAARLMNGHETVRFENRYLCKDGSCRWFNWNARAAVSQQLIYATARDVTEQKTNEDQISRLNADLQKHAAQLETANKELEAFSYSVSHDLRAPLRHIDGFVKLLDKHAGEKLDERGRHFLNIIADAARQMGALIDDLLVFSRMNRTEMRHVKVSSNSLVHEAMDGLQGEMNGRDIHWKIDTLPEVAADPAMLRQVWVNLIANAIKYSRTRKTAEIEIGCADSSNGEFIFFVRDNGVGFDMQYAHKLFGVFQRLHRPDEFEGTGIGLANVRRIVQRHGGRTWAQAKVDSGATFFFSLPKHPNPTNG